MRLAHQLPSRLFTTFIIPCKRTENMTETQIRCQSAEGFGFLRQQVGSGI